MGGAGDPFRYAFQTDAGFSSSVVPNIYTGTRELESENTTTPSNDVEYSGSKAFQCSKNAGNQNLEAGTSNERVSEEVF